MSDIVTRNPWDQLRGFTSARIALGRAGVSMPTAPQLAFQLAHAQARDAVHHDLDAVALASSLTESLCLPCVCVHSAAPDRATYLRRPDLGRRLSADCRLAAGAYDIGFVIADGLSALAVERHALPFLRGWIDTAPAGVTIAPLVIAKQARVALGDEVAEKMKIELVVVMIGERPGLSSPDSMGLYLTWQPRMGMTDERRNCISNVRPEGLAYGDAARKLHYLVAEARRRRLSGVALKDDSDAAVPVVDGPVNFLLSPRSDT